MFGPGDDRRAFPGSASTHFAETRCRFRHAPSSLPVAMLRSVCANGSGFGGSLREVRVETSDGVHEWAFDPATLELRDGLPWMRAEDWVQLYKLFDRPTRVKALTDYLAEE